MPPPEFFAAYADRFPVLGQQGGMTRPGLVRNSRDRAIERLGLRDDTPLDLRRKWATVTLTRGAAIHEVSRRLGHRSIRITVARYGHLAQDDRERCRQVVTTAFQGYPPEGLAVGLAA
ncbi:hypothetical protein V2E29_10030 [Streptomyces diastatochromogenes]|uniref:hypothetical protein n=1 Tax=Streptomyces diastatochromogenes TaxID=42236 RepID=UPI002F26AD62